MTTYTSYPITLYGNIVTDENGTHQKGYLTLETGHGKHGRILDISFTVQNPQYAFAPLHKLLDSQIIYPGLLNLHNHVAWNFIPLWHGDPATSPTFNFDNRFQWQAEDCSEYTNNILALEALVKHYFEDNPLPGPTQTSIQLSAFSEVQAACGGTTVIQESRAYDGALVNNDHVLIRGTGNANDMAIGATQYIDSAVKFYSPSTSVSKNHPANTFGWAPVANSLFGQYASDYTKGSIYSALVHLSEGRFGYLNGGKKDGYTRNEFEAFRSVIEKGSGVNPDFKQPTPASFSLTKFNMIHACGIDPSDTEDIAFLQNYGLSVLWSPVSNCMLYSDTLDIKALLANNINVVLTSDWAPSGSKHVWDESKHAEVFLTSQQGYSQSNARRMLYQMMTINAANALGKGHEMGMIRIGGLADLFILTHTQNIESTDSAIDILFENNDTQTAGVYTGGMLSLADKGTFTPPGFGPSFQPLPQTDGPHAATKYVNFDSGQFQNINIRTIAAVIDVLFASGGSVQVRGKSYTVPPGKFERSKFLVTDDTEYEKYMLALDKWIMAQAS